MRYRLREHIVAPEMHQGHEAATLSKGISPTLPLRDRLFVIFGLAGVIAVSWVYLVIEAGRMGAAPLDMAAMVEMRPRDGMGLLLLFLMWAVMMIAMMLPSAMPMILLQAAVARKAAEGQSFALSLGVFIAGYAVVWTLFSIVATFIQAFLERLALLSPMMVGNSALLGAGILIAAGVYQMTPVKDVCLRQCQTPFAFVATHWRPGLGGAFRMGLHHGLFCVGCCWVLMALLFVGGVMNLLWVAAIAFFVLVEKIAPWGVAAGRLGGVCLIVAGLVVLVHG